MVKGNPVTAASGETKRRAFRRLPDVALYVLLLIMPAVLLVVLSQATRASSDWILSTQSDWQGGILDNVTAPGNYVELEDVQWGGVTTPTSSALNAVDMFTATDGWAVGAGGVIIRWNGASWSTASSPTAQALRDVQMLSATDGWAVGDGGVIIRWNGASWSTVSSPTGNGLRGLHMLSATDGWAVGLSGTIIRWDGASWSTVSSPTANELSAIHMLSATDGWAVGVGGVIIRWDGASWSTVSSPTANKLWSVHMVSSTDGWAVGVGGVIVRWDGASWSTVSSPTANELRGVQMISATDGWAVGDGGVIIRWDGAAWSTILSPTTDWLRDTHMLSPTDGWAVGAGGAIIRRAIGTWSNFSGPTANVVWSVFPLSPTDGWAVGDGGLIFRWNGSGWSSVASPTTNLLYSVFMISPTDGWAVGTSGTIVHWDGSSWSTVSSPTTSELRSVHMLSATDGWAVGASGTVLHWDGSSWSTVSSPTTNNLWSVHMVSATDGWAVGLTGTIIRWNGSSWSTVSSPTSNGFRSVYAVSATDAWAVGGNGAIIRWNGTSWSNASSPTSIELRSVQMLSANEGWAVGLSGTILRWNGSSWVAAPSPTINTLYAVYMLSSTDGWAVGDIGTIIRYTPQYAAAGTATHTFDAGQTADWLSHGYDVANRSLYTYPAGANTSDTSVVTESGTTYVLKKTLSVDLTGIDYIKVKTNLNTNNGSRQVSLKVTVGGVDAFVRSTTSLTMDEFENEVWTGNQSGSTSVQLYLKKDSSSPAIGTNQRFEIYTGLAQQVTSNSFRWAVSSDGIGWSSWYTDFTSIPNSRFLKQEATLETTDASYTPMLFSTTVQWGPGGTAPNNPSSLGQYAADATTSIPVGSDTDDGAATNIYLKLSMSSPNSSDTLTPKVEVRPIGQSFTGSPTHSGSPQAYSGTPLTASIPISGLVPGDQYHWRAWVTGEFGGSGYVSFGGNPDGQTDFRVTTPLAAKINSPVDGGTVSGVVPIVGTAAGIDFDSYIVEYGKGGNPKTWTTVTSSTVSVIDGALANWDAADLRGGYTVRLKAFDTGGGSQIHRITVTVVKPQVVASDAGARATAWGNQRKLVRTAEGTLHAFYEDNSGGVVWKTSIDNGANWVVKATVSSNADEVTVAEAATDDLHIAYHSTGGANVGVVYRKATYSGGDWALSNEVAIDSSGVTRRNPAVVVDQDNLPHLVWVKALGGGTPEAQVYYSRATGDPTVVGNWTADEIISASPSVDMSDPNTNPYAGAALVRNPSTNDLYGIFNIDTSGTGKLVINRALYSGGTWSWGSYYEGSNQVSGRPASAAVVGGNINVIARGGTGVTYLKIPAVGWNNVSAWNNFSLATGAPALSSASITYDGASNLYALYATNNNPTGNIAYRLLPFGKPYTNWRPEKLLTDDSTGNNHPNAKLGSSDGYVEYLWTNRTVAPYNVLYDRIGLLPIDPSSLAQHNFNHLLVPVGGATTDGVVRHLHFDFVMESDNASDTLTPVVEIRPLGTDFTGEATHMGLSEDYSGSPIVISIETTGLAANTDYHWQAWIMGDHGNSEKISFGSNAETETDFHIEAYDALQIDSTFNRDGSPGTSSTDFGLVSPSQSPFVVHADSGKHAVQFTIDTNVNWDLATWAADDLSSGVATIPISALTWRSHGSSDPWTAFQLTPDSLLTDQSPTTGTVFRYDFRLSTIWDYDPGTYSTTITYFADPIP